MLLLKNFASQASPRLTPTARCRATIARSAAALILPIALFCSCTNENAPAQRDRNEKALRSLAYAPTSRVRRSDRHLLGTVTLDENRVQAGRQLLTEERRILLLELDGTVVRSLQSEALGARFLSEAQPAPNGDLLVIDTDRSLLRLDPDWQLLWRTDLPAHHDVTVLSDAIYVLSRRLTDVQHNEEQLPLLIDYISELSPAGTPTREWSLYSLASTWISEEQTRLARLWIQENGPPPRSGSGAYKPDGRLALAFTPLDVFHANYVDVAKANIPGVSKRGDVLVSFREQNRIAFIDLDTQRVVWSWGHDTLEGQHQPVILEDGNILIFDNGVRRRWSRVIEVDPRTQEIVWEYIADPPSSFFSSWGGTVEKLANGNIVITESEKGHVFEVTPDKEIVWDYWHAFEGPRHRTRKTILRSHRVEVAPRDSR